MAPIRVATATQLTEGLAAKASTSALNSAVTSLTAMVQAAVDTTELAATLTATLAPYATDAEALAVATSAVAAAIADLPAPTVENDTITLEKLAPVVRDAIEAGGEVTPETVAEAGAGVFVPLAAAVTIDVGGLDENGDGAVILRDGNGDPVVTLTGIVAGVLGSGPVPDPPGQPGLAAAAGASGEVDLTITAPADEGASAITDYERQFSLAGAGIWTADAHAADAGLTPTVDGLANGTDYDFRVRAVNGDGPGPWSPTATATPTAGGFVPFLHQFGDGDSDTVPPGDDDLSFDVTPLSSDPAWSVGVRGGGLAVLAVGTGSGPLYSREGDPDAPFRTIWEVPGQGANMFAVFIDASHYVRVASNGLWLKNGAAGEVRENETQVATYAVDPQGVFFAVRDGADLSIAYGGATSEVASYTLTGAFATEMTTGIGAGWTASPPDVQVLSFGVLAGAS